MSASDRDAAIHSRYGFALPELHGILRAQGCFDPFHAHHLQFSDLLWLTRGAIAAHRFHPDQMQGLVPLARTAQDDLWCFVPAMGEAGRAPIAYCPDEDEVAHLVAPDFTAFLYRSLLEEYACTGLTEHSGVQQSRETLAQYVDLLAPHFPEAWAERLRGLQALPWTGDRNDYYGAIDGETLDGILAADLAWPRLEEEFEHFTV
jgi:hypothetical protein